jgi:uncharacterized membrane protein YdfJ with MMPL/SSD domain
MQTEDRFLRRLATLVTDHAWLVVVGTVLVTGSLALQIPQLKVHFDPESSLQPDHPFIRIDRMIRAEFGGGLGIVAGDEFPAVSPPEQ